MNVTAEELAALRAPKPPPTRVEKLEAAVREMRTLLDDYEREHLAARNLQFGGAILPRIAEIVRSL